MAERTCIIFKSIAKVKNFMKGHCYIINMTLQRVIISLDRVYLLPSENINDITE